MLEISLAIIALYFLGKIVRVLVDWYLVRTQYGKRSFIKKSLNYIVNGDYE